MKNIKQISSRKNEILSEIESIQSMRPGSVYHQYLNVKHKDKSKPVKRGPYYIYSKKVKGKTIAKRLSKSDAERYKIDVDNYHRFQSLCKEYAELTELLGDLLRKQAESEEDIKKNGYRTRKKSGSNKVS